MIGGLGIELEIDESKFGRKKYNRGRYTEGHWVFGEIERITGNAFLVEVEKRDTTTLVLSPDPKNLKVDRQIQVVGAN